MPPRLIFSYPFISMSGSARYARSAANPPPIRRYRCPLRRYYLTRAFPCDFPCVFPRLLPATPVSCTSCKIPPPARNAAQNVKYKVATPPYFDQICPHHVATPPYPAHFRRAQPRLRALLRSAARAGIHIVSM